MILVLCLLVLNTGLLLLVLRRRSLSRAPRKPKAQLAVPVREVVLPALLYAGDDVAEFKRLWHGGAPNPDTPQGDVARARYRVLERGGVREFWEHGRCKGRR